MEVSSAKYTISYKYYKYAQVVTSIPENNSDNPNYKSNTTSYTSVASEN